MAGTGSDAPLFLAGCVASCGLLLVVAGASKVYRAARRVPDDSAVRRALGVTRRGWRRAQPAVGLLECAAGAVVCAGIYPAVGGTAMAGLGAGFCALLGYARAQRVPGGCGCIEWRAAPVPAAGTVTWPEIARGVLVAVAGVAGAVFLRGQAGAFGRPWFWAGAAAGGAVLIVLSLRVLPRTPVCRRPAWFPARVTLRALAGHGVFAAMAESAGPFGPVVRYRRAGCSQEFWFTPLPPAAERDRARAVVFQVRNLAPGEDLAVQASVRDVPAAGDWPDRAIAVRGPKPVPRRAAAPATRPGHAPYHEETQVPAAGVTGAGYRKGES